MAKSSNRGRRNSSGDWGMIELARERPIAAAAVATGAAAAGLFLWTKRSQISDQLSNLSEQLGDWTNFVGQGGPSGAHDKGGSDAATGRSKRRSSAARAKPVSTPQQ